MRLRRHMGNRLRMAGTQRAPQTSSPSPGETRRERDEREQNPFDGSLLDRLLRGSERARPRPASTPPHQTDQRH
jgi:hypothetical protein